MTTFKLVQAPATPTSPILVGYMIGPLPELEAKMRAALPGAAILTTPERDLAPSTRAIDAARIQAGVGASAPLVLCGWSAGCQTVRAFLNGGLHPAVVVTLDGTAAQFPVPAPGQIEVWQQLALEARRGDRMWVATCTQMSYVERLRAPERPYMSTRHVLERATGLDLPPGTEVQSGGLRVISSPSADIDGPAHIRQVREVFPDVLARHVRPWLEGQVHPVVPDADLEAIGAAVLADVGWGRAILDACETIASLGVVERVKNGGAELEHMFLDPLGLPRGSFYCAAAMAACIRMAASRLGREPLTRGSPGAKATAIPFQKAGRWTPQGPKLLESLRPGDLVVFDRSKKGPGESGFEGHIGAFIDRVGDGSAGLWEGNADRVLAPNGKLFAFCQTERRIAGDHDVLGACHWDS